jgi:hypothetical protein
MLNYGSDISSTPNVTDISPRFNHQGLVYDKTEHHAEVQLEQTWHKP